MNILRFLMQGRQLKNKFSVVLRKYSLQITPGIGFIAQELQDLDEVKDDFFDL